ncbi:dual specificity protein phosphatase 10-like [Pristis pectinata]|uniref:dual specificity protein phosphatase 10-like n=1 Tax=Pristis pectinata TaxID=685728 RepID=UPI00223CA9E6|nr:dual specificity protein phosphatase 10-like [Pristis pectinata]
MPPSPLEEHLVIRVLQRPRSLALHLDQAVCGPKVPGLAEETLVAGLGPEGQSPRLRCRGQQAARKPRLMQQLPGFGRRAVQRKAALQLSPARERSACPASPAASSCRGSMHPLKCGCRGCWRLVRREDSGASSPSCVPCKAGMRALGCGGASSGLRRLGCLPALSCITCDPGVRSLGSSCSFCSSDPIVTYDPRAGQEEEGGGRQLWPRKMTESKAHQQSGVILDCRSLVEYTKIQLQGAMSLGWPEGAARGPGGGGGSEHAKLTVFDLLSSRDAKHCWSQDAGRSEVRPRKAGRPAAPHSLHLVLNPLGAPDKEAPPQGDASEGPASVLGSEPSRAPEARDATSEPPAGPLTPDIEKAELSPILPFLYLGNEQDAQDLGRMRQLNVGYVINVTTHLPLYHAQGGALRYKRLPATDNGRQNLRQYFEEAFEFIEEAQESGKGVLIHCQAGVSRSATLVIAYLMKHTLMTMTDAYKYVKGKRPIISPNLNFMGQLLEFEMDLNKGLTPRILTPKLTGLETEV